MGTLEGNVALVSGSGRRFGHEIAPPHRKVVSIPST